ncbi:MAG: glycosyltransferase family 4 protein [Syntrophales bacterium]
MRIAFVSEYPPDQVNLYGGIPYYMSRAIQRAAEFFQYIQIPSFDWGLALKGGTEGFAELKKRGKSLSKTLLTIDADIVLCQGSGFSTLPYLETEKKVVLWGDATWFTLMEMDFDEFKIRYPFLYEWDCMMLEKCDLVGFAADWVRDQTLLYYNIKPEKVHVIPFGANLEQVSPEAVTRAINNRETKPCQLTFLGIDWQRKGLPLAYEVMNRLNVSGVGAKLNVIGCNISTVSLKRKIEHHVGYKPYEDIDKFQFQFHKDENVNNLGFLRKDNPGQYSLLCEILNKTHFLLHPAHFECFGIALVEANAFGIPVIATNSHGPKSIIRNKVNGQLYECNEYVECASNFIKSVMADREKYNDLAFSSFREYQDRFDWSIIVQELKDLLSPE